MTTKTATIVGPIVDATLTPLANSRFVVRLVTGAPTLARFPDGTVTAAAVGVTDATGEPSAPLVLPLNSESEHPDTWYEATCGSARWGFRLLAGDDGGAVPWGDLAHTVTDTTPPGFTPIAGPPGVVAATGPATYDAGTQTVGVTVGTTAGSVAAGNDSRIVGAEQVAARNASGGYLGLEATGSFFAGSPHPKRRGPRAWRIPDGWGDVWRSAKAQTATSLVTAVVIGDSITTGWADDAAGSGQTWMDAGYAWQMARALQAVLGDGGSGFLPACLIPSAMSIAPGVPGAATGPWTSTYWGGGTWATINRAAGGPNGDAITTATAGATATWPTCRGTTIQVWYLAVLGGRFVVTIDGVAQPEVDSGGFVGWTHVDYAASPGPHTVSIAYTGGAAITIAGIRGINPTGLLVDNLGLPGRRSMDMTTSSTLQKLVVTGGAGTFTITCMGRSTSALAWNASAATISGAVNTLIDPAGETKPVSALSSPAGTVWLSWTEGSYVGRKTPPLTAVGADGCTATLTTIYTGDDRQPFNGTLLALTALTTTGTPAPSLAITSLGTNDPPFPGVGTWTQRALDTIHASLVSAYDTAPTLLVLGQHPNTSVGLNGATADKFIGAQAAQQQTARRYGAAYWDLWAQATRTQWRTPPTVYLASNVGGQHPTIAGHTYIASQLAAMLLDA